MSALIVCACILTGLAIHSVIVRPVLHAFDIV